MLVENILRINYFKGHLTNAYIVRASHKRLSQRKRIYDGFMIHKLIGSHKRFGSTQFKFEIMKKPRLLQQNTLKSIITSWYSFAFEATSWVIADTKSCLIAFILQVNGWTQTHVWHIFLLFFIKHIYICLYNWNFMCSFWYLYWTGIWSASRVYSLRKIEFNKIQSKPNWKQWLNVTNEFHQLILQHLK